MLPNHPVLLHFIIMNIRVKVIKELPAMMAVLVRQDGLQLRREAQLVVNTGEEMNPIKPDITMMPESFSL